MTAPTREPTHQVVVTRRNGRFLKRVPAWSRYAAKQIRGQLEAKYDAGYCVDILPADQEPAI